MVFHYIYADGNMPYPNAIFNGCVLSIASTNSLIVTAAYGLDI